MSINRTGSSSSGVSLGFGIAIDGTVLDEFFGFVRCGELLPGRLDAPDFTCVLGDGAVAGELARGGNVQNGLGGPFLRFLVTKGRLES